MAWRGEIPFPSRRIRQRSLEPMTYVPSGSSALTGEAPGLKMVTICMEHLH